MIFDLNVWFLLQVKVCEVDDVDDIFIKFMGDEVDLCCEFIQDNVLVVVNFDI